MIGGSELEAPKMCITKMVSQEFASGKLVYSITKHIIGPSEYTMSLRLQFSHFLTSKKYGRVYTGEDITRIIGTPAGKIFMTEQWLRHPAMITARDSDCTVIMVNKSAADQINRPFVTVLELETPVAKKRARESDS